MPNKGHIWSEQEKDDLMHLTRTEFATKYPDIGYNAYRHKKRDLTVPQTVEPPAPVQVRAATGYIGPTIGFFDFETTYSSQPRLLSAAWSDGFGDVTVFRLNGEPGVKSLYCEAGCIHEVTTVVPAGDRWIDDGPMAETVRDGLERFSIIAGWNSKLFDVPVINGRLAKHGLRPLHVQMHKDLMYLASGQFMRIGRRSLQSVSEFFASPHRKTPLSPSLWDEADHGDEDAYELIIEHNVADVLVTRDVFAHLEPHVAVLHR